MGKTLRMKKLLPGAFHPEKRLLELITG